MTAARRPTYSSVWFHRTSHAVSAQTDGSVTELWVHFSHPQFKKDLESGRPWLNKVWIRSEWRYMSEWSTVHIERTLHVLQPVRTFGLLARFRRAKTDKVEAAGSW